MISWVRFPVLPRGRFLEGEDSDGDRGLGSLVELRFKGPPGTSYTHNGDNVTAPHGRPNLRSRLHFGHIPGGKPRSPQGTCGGIDKRKLSLSNVLIGEV
jgi:hypothetical protein